ncbi:hypothetical protein ACL07V_35175 [Streptomyces sp. MB22_4]|uniref:hypothetical protein n=1 Tax=Streptomyces sp. MB22_4 TaxID=3383120 RepID=UPI0039A07014
MAVDLDLEQPSAPVLPEGTAYQPIMGVFDHERRTRAKLTRLVSLGFLDETEPGPFTQPRPHAPTASADQRS